MVAPPGVDTFVETLTTVTAIDTNPKDPDFIGVTLTGTLTDSEGHFKASPVELSFSRHPNSREPPERCVLQRDDAPFLNPRPG